MTKKLKDFPEQLKVIDNYLVSREKEDLSKILHKMPAYNQYTDVLNKLKSIDSVLKNKDSVISLDLKVSDLLSEVRTKLKSLPETEEYKSQETTIKKYKASKSALIESLLEEQAELNSFTEQSYYGCSYTILNLPDVNIGRFYEKSLGLIPSTQHTMYNTTKDSLLCGNLIVPEIAVSTRGYGNKSSYFLFMCSSDFLYTKNVWNEQCINFMSTRFNAKKDVEEYYYLLFK